MSLNPRQRRNVMRKLFEKQRGSCCYCGVLVRFDVKPTSPRRATIEHLNRKFEGGSDCRDNLAMACAHCNVGRGQLDWLTYKSYVMGEI